MRRDRQRQRVTRAMLSAAFLGIRVTAGHRPGQGPEATRLAEIRHIADLCLTASSSSAAARSRLGFDPLVRLWQEASDDLRDLMRHNLEVQGLDHRWLDDAAPIGAQQSCRTPVPSSPA